MNNLTEDSNGNALQIAVYAEANTEAPFAIVVPETEPETEGPFVPYTFGDGYIVTCSAPPAEHCPTYDSYAGGDRTLLSATMTVAQRPPTLLKRLGYGHFLRPDTTNLHAIRNPRQHDVYVEQYAVHHPEHFRTCRSPRRFILAVRSVKRTRDRRQQFTLHVRDPAVCFRRCHIPSDTISHITWFDSFLTWSVGDSVAVKITGPPLPNAYGYRTIWTALMTADTIGSTAFVGYNRATASHAGDLTNNLIVTGRDETVTIGTPGQPRYPWIGYEIEQISDITTRTQISFDRNAYPSADEVAGWTLTLGGGVELPFADAQLAHATTPWVWQFTHAPGWSAGDQVLVSIRNDEVQNRVGQTAGERSGQAR